MKAKAKILLVAHVPRAFTQFSSGLALMRRLRDRGFEVAAAGTYEEPEVSMIRDEGFNYHEFYVPRSIRPIADIKAVASLYRILKRERIDITHSQSAKAGIINRLAGRLAGTPIVLQTVHAWPFHDFCSSLQKMTYKFIERRAARMCDGIVVDSKEVLRRGIEARICPQEKLKQIYMGIDTDKFRPFDDADKAQAREELGCGPDEYVIGSAARLVPGKGHDTLIKAFGRILDQHPNSRCLIAGDGELEAELRRLIDDLEIGQRCILLGRLTDMAAFHNALDVFCLPTHREGFGVSLAEAMSCGVPVVTTDVAPLDETVLDGVTGYLEPMDDTEAFAKRLAELSDPLRRGEFSKACVDHVRTNFAIDAINDITISYYEYILRKKLSGLL